MADYTVYNYTDEVIEDVNAGDDDAVVGFNAAIMLEDDEMADLVNGGGALVFPEDTSEDDILALLASGGTVVDIVADTVDVDISDPVAVAVALTTLRDYRDLIVAQRLVVKEQATAAASILATRVRIADTAARAADGR